MEKKSYKILKDVGNWILCIFSAFILATFLQSQVFALTEVQQRSMEDTLIEGEKLILSKISYTFSEPKQGDIVVFLKEDETNSFVKRINIFFNDLGLKFKKQDPRDDRLIKRVIGISGDEITINNGSIYVNDVKLEEQYVKGLTTGKNVSEIVPQGYVFVVGDHRPMSDDSRNFGPVNMNNIEGKIIYRISPVKRIGKP